MNKDDNTFVPVASPVGSIMSRLMARTALKDSDTLRETARASGNDHLNRHAAKRLLDYERHAEDSQRRA